MKQKIAIARALLHRPSLIFLDEPTAGLDPVAAAALREDIVALVEKDGVTVFLNTHNLSEAEKLCTRVGMICNGKLLAVGSPDELKGRKDASRVIITGSGFTEQLVNQLRMQPGVKAAALQNGHLEITLFDKENISSVLGFLVNAGVRVSEARRDQTSLEEVFLQLMEE